MSTDLTRTITEICAMPVAERLQIIEAIWASLPSDAMPPTPDLEEVSKRFAEDEANPDDTLSWQEVMEEVRRRS